MYGTSYTDVFFDEVKSCDVIMHYYVYDLHFIHVGHYGICETTFISCCVSVCLWLN